AVGRLLQGGGAAGAGAGGGAAARGRGRQRRGGRARPQIQGIARRGGPRALHRLRADWCRIELGHGAAKCGACGSGRGRCRSAARCAGSPPEAVSARRSARWSPAGAHGTRQRTGKHRTGMTETKETTEKTLRGAAPRKPLSLKRTVEAGHVKQRFSHGRSKSGVVEKKKKRTISGPSGEGEEASTEAAEADRLLAEVMQRPGGLSSDELDARRRALEAARERAEREEMERARLEALAPQAPE